MADDKSSIDAVAKLTRAANQPIISEQVHFIVIPDGHKLESLERFQFANNPARKQGTAKFTEIASFSEYFNRFRDEHSLIFGNYDKFAFVGVLDYHHAGDGPARHGQHRAVYVATKTQEWQEWLASSGKQMDQTDFATFLEDHAPDISEPAAAVMLECARDLSAKSEVNFASAIRLNNGQTQFTYQENIKGSVGNGKLEVPESFKIRVPVIQGGPQYTLTARLRYRIKEGKLVFWYDLLRASKVVEESFRDALKEVGTQTGTAVLIGDVGQ